MQRPGRVAVNLEQVDPRLGHASHVRGILLLVKLPIFLAGGKALDEFGPGLIRLAGKQYVAQAVEEGFIHGSISPADDGEDPHFTDRSQDLSHAIPLDYHSRHTDDIEPFEELEVNFFDVFVEEINLMVGHQTSEMRQCSRGHRTFLVTGIEWQGIVEAPIRGLEFRIDETNLQSLHGESTFLKFGFFKSVELADPALFSVVTGYPVGQLPSHASSVSLLRRGITAVSNLGTGL